MKSTIAFAALWCIAVAECSYDRATHIIKLKSSMNMSSAHDFIVANHKAYSLSRNEPKGSFYRRSFIHNNEPIYSSPNLEPKIFLDSLTVDNKFTAISGIFPDDRFIDYLHQQSHVEYVEINQIYKAQALRPLQEYRAMNNTSKSYVQRMQSFPYTSSNVRRKRRGVIRTAETPNWGQARITRHELGDLNKYMYDEAAGEGVDVYVLDTGINTEHQDFGGRAVVDANFVDYENEDDLGGHGTHVAAKIAGQLFGVARKATVHSVKILDKAGDGTTINLIKAITHVIRVAKPGKTVINLSLSGPKSRLIDDIISQAVMDHQIPVFVSSGNTATDACFFSPSSNAHVFAVGASDVYDEVPYYSNTGGCVRVYAPGSDIESAWIGTSGRDTKVLDGTSMANPHVSGIAAILLSRKSYTAVDDLYNDIAQTATDNVLSFVWSDTDNINKLAFVDVT